MKTRNTWTALATIGVISFASLNAEPIDSRDPATIAKKAQEEKPTATDKTKSKETPTTPADPRKPATLAPDDTKEFATSDQSKTLAQQVMDSGELSTLEKAVIAAGLAPTLQQDGPYTVFAPSDEAFEKLPEEVLADLMMPENKEKLKKLLLAHVVKGKMTSSQIESGTPTAVSGDKLDVVVSDEGVMVVDAEVVETDIEASNGVIHVVDTVIMPEPSQ